MTEPAWHTLEADEVLRRLESAPDGLAAEEAAGRLERAGPNELRAARRVTPWMILRAQLANTLVIILLIATALSVVLGEAVEAVAIGVIVAFAVILGFIQEYRAERAIEALREMTAPTATVRRGGESREVPAREVVPGDVVVLHPGDRIPADARLLEAASLQTDEAPLTGESLPVEKQTAALDDPGLGAGDRTNLVYAGTLVTAGRGRAVVIATGMGTEFGRVAGMLESVAPGPTPLQQNLQRVGGVLARLALAVVAVIAGIGLVRGQPFVEVLLFGVALAVAVVPEALPAVVTISLALGVRRMAARNVLVRRLPAVETLGSTSVICSDKTGTMTRDEMTLRRIVAGDETWEVTGAGYAPEGELRRDGSPVEPSPAVLELLRAGVLASDARVRCLQGRWRVEGDPTEGALLVAAAKAGLDGDRLAGELPRVDEIPFSSETKRMVTLHRLPDGGIRAFAKGAPEVILDSCTARWTAGGPVPLDGEARRAVLARARGLAGEALRVLALAVRDQATRENAEREMVFLGLVGMIDPPRPEAREAIETCRAAGIRVVMMTGDHPDTASAVARELGLDPHGSVVTGAALDGMDDATLARRVEEIRVYARVSPAHKLRVVQALQARGHVTAMTGDGVNDAPTLKQADIGIAMGITGTDVTREASSMMLTDDNFASIVAAVEEGRGVFSNIKKYLMYLLSSNIGEIGLISAATLLGMPMPLSAVQILYVNLATDGLPALALAVDPPEEDLMRRPPRDGRTGIFTRPVVVLLLAGGLWSALVNLGIFAWALESGRPLSEAMTMVFASLVLIQFFKAYGFRSDRHSALRRPFANRWLNRAILWEVLLLSLILYLPWLQRPFGTQALSAADWAVVGGLAFSVLPLLEAAKWAERRGWMGAARE